MPSLLLLFQSPHLRRERSRSRDRGARGRGTFYAGARGCFFRAFSSAFSPTITSSPVSLSLSGERVSLFLRLYYDKRLLMFISSDSIARGVCICRSCRPSYGRTLARAEFLWEKEGKNEPKKEFKSTATTAIITATATTTAHTARVLRLCLCV